MSSVYAYRFSINSMKINTYKKSRGSVPVIVIIIVVILVLLGGIYFVAKYQDDSGKALGGGNLIITSSSTDTVEISTNTNQGKANTNMSIRDLLTRGGAYRCSITNTPSMNLPPGTVYISGGNLRGDFLSVTTKGNIESHIIKNGDDVYVWSNTMANRGMKISTATFLSTSQPQIEGAVNIDVQLPYDCVFSEAGPTTFVLPEDYQFTEISGGVQGTSSIPTSK